MENNYSLLIKLTSGAKKNIRKMQDILSNLCNSTNSKLANKLYFARRNLNKVTEASKLLSVLDFEKYSGYPGEDFKDIKQVYTRIKEGLELLRDKLQEDIDSSFKDKGSLQKLGDLKKDIQVVTKAQESLKFFDFDMGLTNKDWDLDPDEAKSKKIDKGWSK